MWRESHFFAGGFFVVLTLALFWIGYVLRAVIRTKNLPMCWYCGASKVRRSGTHSFLDTFITMVFFLKPYRCHGCLVRFYAFRRGPQALGLS
jgi:hypothetical protein